jgi:class 3 adenylate cyclase
MSQVASPDVEAGREAYERHAWSEALERLQAADEASSLDPEDLERLAEAAWFGGRPELAIDARERAHAAYLERGDRCRAAWVGLALAELYFDRHEKAVSRGWMSRSGRLIADDPDCVAHGRYAMMVAYWALKAGDLEQALEEARRAEEIATRMGNPGLVALGLQAQGMVLAFQGRTEEGLALSDEATAAAVAGELDPHTTGVVYCMTIGLCRELNDWRRAGEWTEVAERWCQRRGVSGFPGICRVHRAEIMHLRGAWVDAEAEARRASIELKGYDVNATATAFYEIGEIRLRVGDLPGAEEAFLQAHELGREPEPGLSLLRLARGEVGSANASILRALEEEPAAAVPRPRLLPAAVEIAVAAGDLEMARRAASELETVAERFGTQAMEATARWAQGAVRLAEGDAAGARKELRRALALWNEVEAPYEAARVRMLLGEAYRADGDEHTAALELRAAKSAFERLGALPDAERAADLLGEEAGSTGGERVTRVFMFTDIVGSTNLAEAMGDEGWEEVLARHDRILRAAFDGHGAEIVRHSGDGFFVTFPETEAAVESAVAIQRTLARHREEDGFVPEVRIGMHVAEATRRSRDYVGKGVHEAARIGALAEGDEILASGETIVGMRLRFSVSEPREVSLRGVSEPVEVVTIDWG